MCMKTHVCVEYVHTFVHMVGVCLCVCCMKRLKPDGQNSHVTPWTLDGVYDVTCVVLYMIYITVNHVQHNPCYTIEKIQRLIGNWQLNSHIRPFGTSEQALLNY